MNSFDTPQGCSGVRSEEEEDLGWLRDLEASSKQPATWIHLNKIEAGRPTSKRHQAPRSPLRQDDLSWLMTWVESQRPHTCLLTTFCSERRSELAERIWVIRRTFTPSKPSAPKEDLSWLQNLGGTSEPLPSTPSQSAAPKGLKLATESRRTVRGLRHLHPNLL